METTPPHLLHGYWSPHIENPGGWVLKRKTAGRWVTWMSLTLMELESHQPHIDAAHGTVLVGGLGMGMYLYNILRKPEVDHVLVVERDKDVLEMFQKVSGYQTWEGWEKLIFVPGDVLNLGSSPTSRRPDFMYLDIWPAMGDGRALKQTQEVQKVVGAGKVGFWTQEYDFVTYLMSKRIRFADGQGLTLEEYGRFVRETGMPLIGEEWATYPILAALAVTLQTGLYGKDPVLRLVTMQAVERLAGMTRTW